MRILAFFLSGVVAGSMITVQSVLNAALGKRAGNLGSVFLLTIISFVTLLLLVLLLPYTANLRNLPGPSEWYLYLGGVLGVVILAAPIFLVPRIGATSTLTALVLGQLILAVLVDHFGLFAVPRIEVGLARLAGVLFLVFGAFLIAR